MAVERVVVEVDLGVEGEHVPVRSEQERVDLEQRGVDGLEGAVQRLHERRPRAASVAAGRSRPKASLRAWKGWKPTAGSIDLLQDRLRVRAPRPPRCPCRPATEAMNTGAPVARSTTMARYISRAPSRSIPCSMSRRRTTRPSGPVWCVLQRHAEHGLGDLLARPRRCARASRRPPCRGRRRGSAPSPPPGSPAPWPPRPPRRRCRRPCPAARARRSEARTALPWYSWIFNGVTSGRDRKRGLYRYLRTRTSPSRIVMGPKVGRPRAPASTPMRPSSR